MSVLKQMLLFVNHFMRFGFMDLLLDSNRLRVYDQFYAGKGISMESPPQCAPDGTQAARSTANPCRKID